MVAGVSVEGRLLSHSLEPEEDREEIPCTPSPAVLRRPFAAPSSSANTMFEMEWRGRRVALKASNGRYVCMKKNGQLAAISDFVGKDEEFTLKLINRPILVLRGLDGFVCHRRGSNQLDTNRSVYDVFHLSFSDGAYQIRGARRAG
ncbi:PREDICTED: fascin-2-like, partial [Rhinopithecus bieti]|uniref:fascin-2-like n=1 Tax=Rhinopithecus bieti TaxID=61621 RepID=UPI00083C3870